jgi:hypothetical protein
MSLIGCNISSVVDALSFGIITTKMCGDCLQVGKGRGVLRDRLVHKVPQGSQQKGEIRGHLDPLARQELLEVLVSEVPLDPKDCKDFLARKYVTLATLLLLN